MTNKQNPKFQELVAKLREIFQIDRPELDFGIYRILNARAGEINHYLENRLAEKVQQALSSGNEAQREQVTRELKEKEAQYQGDGINPDTVPKVVELRQKLAQYSAGASEHENAVFSHLLTFFSRYYEQGDFISQRRYKGDTYAIPYAGEEVMLHWANKDQYYTKSGENFSNYSFKLEDGRTVHFRLAAADTAKDNRKDNDKERRFALVTAKTVTRVDENGEEYDEELVPVEEVSGSDGNQELIIRFEYAAQPKGTKQEALVTKAVEAVLADAAVKARWLALGSRAPTEKNPQRTLLEKHLSDYTTKNTADYFIHKDLGGFLRRELDFYVKNEVMHLDDVQNAGAFADIEKNLRMIQCLRSIALELIAFLAQLEDFQKKLWLKKKFVVSSHYCITLDRVPETMWPEVAANEQQWAQWKQLGVWDGDAPGTMTDLKASPYRMVDTSLFAEEFKGKLLQEVPNLETATNGLLVHSDNFQALALLCTRYREDIKCFYIDPPFNLGQNADFLYKTDYKDSSWATLLANRLHFAVKLLQTNGMAYVRCDYNGNYIIRPILDSLFGAENLQAELLVQRIRKNVTTQGRISLPLANDSLFFYTKNVSTELVDSYVKLAEKREAYWRRFDDSAGFRNPPERVIFGKTFKPYKHDAHFKYSQSSIEKMIEEKRIRLRCMACSHEHYAGVWTMCEKCGSDNAVPQYLVMESDKKILDTNWTDIAGYAHSTGFPTENSEVLLQRVFKVASKTGETVLDFFAGSGTSLAVALKTSRRWVGVEQGEQLFFHIVPRLQKAAYKEKVSHCFKIITLESYEDTLNNLQLSRTPAQGDLLNALPQQAKDDYLVNYLLDVESRGSLLSVDDFKKPFDYALNVAVDSAGAFEPRKIDLVETFNYLIGLRVKHIDAQPQRGFVTITGTLPSYETCLVLWRDCDVLDYEGVAKLCDKLAINPADNEFDVVYINGDHNIPTVLTQTAEEGGATRVLKLRQIEPEFLERMFSVEDI